MSIWKNNNDRSFTRVSDLPNHQFLDGLQRTQKRWQKVCESQKLGELLVGGGSSEEWRYDIVQDLDEKHWCQVALG